MKHLLALALILLCASTLALAETDNSVYTSVSNSSADQIKEHNINYTLVNLTQRGIDRPAIAGTGFNVSLAASGNNANTFLVQAAPGEVLKMHYHKNRDEVVYIPKGEAIFTISGVNYTARAGDLIYLPEMIPHMVVATGNETLQIVSTFAPPFDGKDRIFI